MEDKMWRLFEFHFAGKTFHLISERPMTDSEVEEVYKRARCNFNLNDLGVGYSYSAPIVDGCISSNSKKVCEEAKQQLDNGKSFSEILFAETEG